MDINDTDIYEIDLNRLEEENCNQVPLFREWAGRLKESQARLRRLKSKLERVKAGISLRIWKDPKKFKLRDKPAPTAGMINNIVIRNKKYKAIEEKVIAEKEKMDMLEVVVKALDDRRKAIDGSIRLHGQEYFSKPHTSYSGKRKMKRVKSND